MRRVVVLVLTVVAAACGSSSAPSSASCASRAPERVVDSPLEVKDLSVEVPERTLDLNGDGVADQVAVENGVITVDSLTLITGAPAGLSIRTWADLDDDGDDDLLVDDGRLWLIEGGRISGRHSVDDLGVPVPDELTTMWPASLDDTPGGDFYVVHDTGGHSTTDVYSGEKTLRGGAPVAPLHLTGSPRALARLSKGGPLETVLLDGGPVWTVTFAPRRRPPLRADVGESHRVTWVRVFDERGTRKIALQVDRKVAVWRVPETCH